ncbi:MAG: MBL fold metallo-hydrolase [Candidatus Heimdallarchaeota archaeon]|nr:MBL fold metallo-hydrolase [Candidatus Heimdallarchaeota archaeon]
MRSDAQKYKLVSDIQILMQWYYILIIVIGALLFAILSLVVWYMNYISPYPTGKVSDNISVIKTGIVNCYVYSKGSKRILIDTGTSTKKLLKGLATIGIEPESISNVFLTHSDPDHIGGISLFSHAKRNIGEKSKVKNPEKYQFLDDGEITDVNGIKIHAISTPGHRLGHTAYIIDEEFLFTGDALRLKKGEVQPFLRIISSDFEKQKRTIEMLAELDNISILFTAHNGFTTNFDKAIENWKKVKRKD